MGLSSYRLFLLQHLDLYSDDFKYFCGSLSSKSEIEHMDWVPCHFPKDELVFMNLMASYEYTDSLKMEHKLWGTRAWFCRNEVISFLIFCNLLIEEHHRTVSKSGCCHKFMPHLNYQRNDGEWRPNIYGDIVEI